MTPTLLTAAILAQPQCRANRSTVRRLVPLILHSSRRWRVPPEVLAAVILHETGMRNVVRCHRGKGRRGCDVGFAQIHVPRWKQNRDLVHKYRVPRHNIRRSAQILYLSRTRCKRVRHPRCTMCPWCFYNFGSRKWCPGMQRILRNIQRYCAEKAKAPRQAS